MLFYKMYKLLLSSLLLTYFKTCVKFKSKTHDTLIISTAIVQYTVNLGFSFTFDVKYCNGKIFN